MKTNIIKTVLIALGIQPLVASKDLPDKSCIGMPVNKGDSYFLFMVMGYDEKTMSVKVIAAKNDDDVLTVLDNTYIIFETVTTEENRVGLKLVPKEKFYD